jgi:hypothetical protein
MCQVKDRLGQLWDEGRQARQVQEPHTQPSSSKSSREPSEQGRCMAAVTAATQQLLNTSRVR